jgi:predicted HicB family RNase H-like nuclease
MPKTQKEFNQVEYQNKFINEKYDRINLTVPKGEKAVIKEKATAAGESVNEYINQAIKQRMGAENNV